MAKIIAKKKIGPQASRKPCDSKPSRPERWPSWKISLATPKAAPVESRLARTPIAATSGAWKATSSKQEAKRRARRRSQAGSSPPGPLRDRGFRPRDRRPALRGQFSAQPVDGFTSGAGRGAVRRHRRTRTRLPPALGSGGETAAMPGSDRSVATVAARWDGGAITCRVPGAPWPKAALPAGSRPATDRSSARP